ncbi:FKBP-type peptidyl-prolyl cis-trans isomerase [Acidothermaceae bacterium B102]|nr:FKBP-type peptidyl-prolyl cis-trans isomerase [Acidothermaceae bacterium B102]
MRRSPLVLASCVAIAAVLTGCANGSTTSHGASASPSTAAATSAAAAAATTASAASGAAATPNKLEALPAGTALPTASGAYGTKPALTFPTQSGPPKTVQTKILKQGTGPVVAKGDLLVADYLGQIWGGAVFDNSYDRKAPTGFQIGTGKVIPGWDSTLVGVKAGTRILLSIPPAEGYGASGQSSAGISGTDTLVFIVDVISSYDKTVSADPKAVPQTLPQTLPQVSGPLTGAPTVTIPKTAPEPTKTSTTVVAKGTGPVVGASTVVLQYFVQSWQGQTVASTRTDGAPIAVTIGGSTPSVFDTLKGLPVGSRVLIAIPASSSQTSASASPTTEPAVAVVVDIVAVVPAG